MRRRCHYAADQGRTEARPSVLRMTPWCLEPGHDRAAALAYPLAVHAAPPRVAVDGTQHAGLHRRWSAQGDDGHERREDGARAQDPEAEKGEGPEVVGRRDS